MANKDGFWLRKLIIALGLKGDATWDDCEAEIARLKRELAETLEQLQDEYRQQHEDRWGWTIDDDPFLKG